MAAAAAALTLAVAVAVLVAAVSAVLAAAAAAALDAAASAVAMAEGLIKYSSRRQLNFPIESHEHLFQSVDVDPFKTRTKKYFHNFHISKRGLRQFRAMILFL